MLRLKTTVALAAVLAGGWTAGLAGAETTLCTEITVLPYTITASGNYCLRMNWTYGLGTAIIINANNVTLDLNGFKLDGGTGGLGTPASGIYALDRKGIVVRNGIIRGFYGGINIARTITGVSEGHLVEDLHLVENRVRGVFVDGRGSVVRRCRVTSTGGSTANPNPFGVFMAGEGAQTLDNSVINTYAGSGGIATGIHHNSASHQMAVGNRIVGTDGGLAMMSISGKYRDNVVSGAGTPYLGGTDLGNNN